MLYKEIIAVSSQISRGERESFALQVCLFAEQKLLATLTHFDVNARSFSVALALARV
jgi:hypothetical protein